MDEYKSLSHSNTEMPKEGALRAIETVSGWGVPPIGREEMGELLAPIMAFQGEHVLQTQDLYDDEEVRVLQDAIPVSIRRIHSR